MSLNHSPSIVTDGLVLYYDMNNSQKSWKGAPTVNLVTNPTYEANPNATGNEFVQWGDIAPIFDTYGTTGIVYSLSFDLKSKIAGPIRVYMQNGSATKYAFVNQDVTATTEYQRFTINGLSASIQTPTETLAKLAFYGTYETGRIASIKNVQIQINAFATPFINGTRTNTQSLLDLTNNNTLTATSLTYASDNTFSFTGTSDYINVPSTSSLHFLGISPYTLEAWVYPTANPGANNWTGIFNREYNVGSGRDGYNLYFNGSAGTSTSFSTERFCSGTGISASLYIDQSLSVNNWSHLVATYDGANIKMYRNGVFQNSTASSGSISNATTNLTIGRRDINYFNGNIPVVKIYNRALSAAEVSQNFNALRGRYGI